MLLRTAWQLLFIVLCSVVAGSKKIGDEPGLTDLRHFPVKNDVKDMIAEIQNDYEYFGTVLLEDKNGNIVKGIERSKRGDPVDVTIEIVRQWLQGKGRKPVTWQTFVECLKEANLHRAAEDIERALSSTIPPPDTSTKPQPAPSPAPTTGGCHSISKKRELEKAVADFGDWETLCEYLGVPNAVINELRSSTMENARKKSRCLEAYLNTGEACWEEVVKVVADYPFHNKRLARQIATDHGVDYSSVIKDEL